MKGLDLDRVRRSIAAPPKLIEGDAETRRAAVAAILHPTGSDLEILLIRRAEREDDPWSGHMAFPGGRFDPRDVDLRATAARETLEEVGLDLDRDGTYLGRLDDVIPGGSRGLVSGLVVSAFLWSLDARPKLVPNGIEVDEIVWADLAPMMSGERDTTYPYVFRGQPMQFPGYRVGNGAPRVVWGMTHRMLQAFFARMRDA